MTKNYSNIQMGKMATTTMGDNYQSTNLTKGSSLTTSEEYLNRKIAFIQNHINNLLIEITNLPEPWTYAVTEDGRVFFINEDEQQTTWLHPKTGQPVSVMIIPPLEDLPTGWQKDYILGLPYLIDHNSKRNFLNSLLNKAATEAGNPSKKSPKNHIRPEKILTDAILKLEPKESEEPKSIIKKNTGNYLESTNMRSPSKTRENLNQNMSNTVVSPSTKKHHPQMISADISSSASSLSNSNNNNNSYSTQNNNIDQLNIDTALRKYGWLHKLSHNGLKMWRKRYFVLTDYILDYYSDSTMSKHCGTIFLNNTISRTTNKKDGSSANNKKHSFKVELLNPEMVKSNSNLNTTGLTNDVFIFLAADSTANMNEWINKFNFVSKLKDSNNTRTGFIEKHGSSNRSASNTSTRTSKENSSSFIVKHDNSGNKSKSFVRSSKSSSAPSSPNLDSKDNAKKSNISQGKLRSSISQSANMNRVGENGSSKKVKKKLAFSDDEILNDRPSTQSMGRSSRHHLSDYETDGGYTTDGFNDKNNKHKRGSSLTKLSRNRNKSNNGNYDYKPIYDAFERPIHEMSKNGTKSTNNSPPKDQAIRNMNHNYSYLPTNGNYNTISKLIGIDKNSKQDSIDTSSKLEQSNAQFENYMDREKIAAANAAANAAMNAIEKEKDVVINSNFNSNNGNYGNTKTNSPSALAVLPKVISSFYNITKSQIEELPKNEVQMLIRQLRRNFVLLNHSQQRFTILHKLFEPYELIYQHKQSQSNISNNKIDDMYNMNELTQNLHDSYVTITDRILKIEFKMDSVENSLRLAQQYHDSTSTSCNEVNNEQSNSKYSSYFRLYEYQIVEMQHEYELLLEDKIIIEKLLDNQMRIFSKYENLSNEKTLMQQFNALTQEMDQLKLQLNKVNQLLNDTISEKCKQELMHTQQQQNKSNYMQQNTSNANFNSKSDNGNLFRASLVPVGNGSSNPLIGDTKSVSSIWKTSNSPGKQQVQKKISTNGVQFSSIDNLADDYLDRKINNYAQLEMPRVKQNGNPQYRSSMYNPNHHYYYLNNELQKSKLDSNISKSNDALYSDPNRNFFNESANGAFNYPPKKTALLDLKDDYRDSFQPVNFTQNRPNQNGQNQQPQPKGLRENFKRESIAEKKRASIGKFPQNLNYSTVGRSSELFQPIPTQQQINNKMQQSARERLFGNNQNYGNISQLNQQQNPTEHDQSINRKIAMVKPELRNSCENDLIQRFTHQNQMEYFDTDYSEIINKNIQKPDYFAIPNRGSLEIDPDNELTEDEHRAKEKRMLEIKKMIALQSIQQIDDLNNLNNSYSCYGKQNTSIPYSEMNYDKEKKARDQLIDLRHELAEQIKEKTRHSVQIAALNGSNGFSSSSTSSSIPIEIENRSNENGMPNSVFVSKMAQTYDRIHMNHVNHNNNFNCNNEHRKSISGHISPRKY